MKELRGAMPPRILGLEPPLQTKQDIVLRPAADDSNAAQ